MLKSNTKKARLNLMRYIRTASAPYYIENCGNPADITDDELCALILDEFKQNWSHEFERNFRRCAAIPYQKMFLDWGSGLTAGGLFDFYYHCNASDILGDILEETDAERAQFTEEQAETRLGYLIFAEVLHRAEKSGLCRLPY